jgi:hypothetical protein
MKVYGESILAKVTELLKRFDQLEEANRNLYLRHRPYKFTARCTDCGNPRSFSQGPDAYAVYVSECWHCEQKKKERSR